jgi:hypothetical protein
LKKQIKQQRQQMLIVQQIQAEHIQTENPRNCDKHYGNRQSRKNSFLAATIAVMFFFGTVVGGISPSYGIEADNPSDKALQQSIEKTHSYLMSAVDNPTFGTVGGEWTILGLARSKVGVTDNYKKIYLENVRKIMADQKGILSRVKYTEYSRLILALTALGEDVSQLEGYNLLDYLADLDQVTKQGVNGPAFALLALDSRGYELPKAAVEEVIKNGGTSANREALIDYLLLRGPQEGDVDRTAMMLQALSPYKSDSRVKAFGEKAFTVIETQENSDGTFRLGESDTLESLIQVIIAKERWGKDVDNNIEALMNYRLANGSFEHIIGQGSNLMSTEQAFYALVNHQRNLEGKTDIY